MPNSTEYNELSKRITVLRKNMLPSSFDPIGNYPLRWQDRCKGFLILSHAEIEYYIESQCKKVVINSIRKWKNHSISDRVLLALSLSFDFNWSIKKNLNIDELIESVSKNKSINTSIDELIDKANNQYLAKVNDNHGIKEENLKQLLIPLSIDLDNVDNNLIIELDDLGKIRGENAHNSSKVTQQLDPDIIYKRTRHIIKMLKELDKIFIGLL